MVQLNKFWEPPSFSKETNLHLYGPDNFVLVLSQLLSLDLVSPDDGLLEQLELRFVKRGIQIIAHEEIDELDYPIFIKSVIPKFLPAKIYANSSSLETQFLKTEKAVQLITSEIIEIKKEVRLFILDQKILDAAFYEGEGDPKAAIHFANEFLANTSVLFPDSFVLDLGWSPQLDWFIVEFNASWGAGLNGCDPKKVWPAIARATKT